MWAASSSSFLAAVETSLFCLSLDPAQVSGGPPFPATTRREGPPLHPPAWSRTSLPTAALHGGPPRPRKGNRGRRWASCLDPQAAPEPAGPWPLAWLPPTSPDASVSLSGSWGVVPRAGEMGQGCDLRWGPPTPPRAPGPTPGRAVPTPARCRKGSVGLAPSKPVWFSPLARFLGAGAQPRGSQHALQRPGWRRALTQACSSAACWPGAGGSGQPLRLHSLLGNGDKSQGAPRRARGRGSVGSTPSCRARGHPAGPDAVLCAGLLAGRPCPSLGLLLFPLCVPGLKLADPAWKRVWKCPWVSVQGPNRPPEVPSTED